MTDSDLYTCSASLVGVTGPGRARLRHTPAPSPWSGPLAWWWGDNVLYISGGGGSVITAIYTKNLTLSK